MNWTDDDNNGAVVSTSPSFTIDSIEKNYHLTANFTKAYTITASADPTEGGTVTGGGTYAQGEDVTLTATPNRGWNFIQWDVQPDGPVETANPWAFQASDDLAATATFEKIPAAYQPEDIVDTTVPGGTVTLTDANDNGVIEYDEKVTITVTPDTGSIFEKWVDKDGNEFSKDTTLTFDPADYDSQLPIKPVYSNDPTYIPDQDGDGQPEHDGDGIFDGSDSGNTYIPDQDGDNQPEADKDGDGASLTLWMGLMAASLLTCVVMNKKYKKV